MKTKPVSTRRRFFWKAGAALSAPLAVGASQASAADGNDAAALKARLAELDDLNALRDLQQQLFRRINSDAGESIGSLFVNASEARAFADLSHLAPADFGEFDVIELARDRQSASAEIHCAAETVTPIAADCTIAEMALQQGDGRMRRTEARVLQADFVKQSAGWKIRRLSFR